MPLPLDPRFVAALASEASARSLLNQLHQDVLNCRDRDALSRILGRYTATAAVRLSRMTASLRGAPAPTTQRESQMAQMLSSISKQTHDAANAIINNIKA